MDKPEFSDAATKFRTQLGLTADVSRESQTSEQGERINRELRAIGERANPVPAHLKYMGSVAAHIYYNETLKQMFFVQQAGPTIKDCPEHMAAAAIRDLSGTAMETFGRRRPKMRSGF